MRGVHLRKSICAAELHPQPWECVLGVFVFFRPPPPAAAVVLVVLVSVVVVVVIVTFFF